MGYESSVNARVRRYVEAELHTIGRTIRCMLCVILYGLEVSCQRLPVTEIVEVVVNTILGSQHCLYNKRF